MQQMYDIMEWARRLGICRRQAELMVADGRIPPPVRIGRIRRWTEAQIDTWIAEQVEIARNSAPVWDTDRPRRGR